MSICLFGWTYSIFQIWFSKPRLCSFYIYIYIYRRIWYISSVFVMSQIIFCLCASKYWTVLVLCYIHTILNNFIFNLYIIFQDSTIMSSVKHNVCDFSSLTPIYSWFYIYSCIWLPDEHPILTPFRSLRSYLSWPLSSS